jgi:dolichol-phosphate mannosyltransferase
MKSWGLILPSYLENDALPELLEALIQLKIAGGVVLVVDDSPYEVGEEIRSLCESLPFPDSIDFHFIVRAKKSGRGSAVRHGMEFLRKEYPQILFTVEADTDGSHQPQDIVKLLREEGEWDVIIGSRYLPQSSISGWSVFRRFSSRVLNIVVPKILGLGVSDITNGLRRYSAKATTLILSSPQENDGFIYLSEQLLCLKKHDLLTLELPIEFLNRRTGVSSVTPRLVFESLKGLMTLTIKERRN